MKGKTMQPAQHANANAALTLSIELAGKSWKIAATDGKQANPALFKTEVEHRGSRLEDLVGRIEALKKKWRLPAGAAVVVIYEAGQDGFWIARALQARGIQVFVVDPASIPVARHQRRRKTDRLDAIKLLEVLRAWLRGERSEVHMVRIPSEDAEAQRLLTRRRGLLQKEILQHRDRMRKLLLLHGCAESVDRGFAERLMAGQLRRADGRPLPQQLWDWLLLECERLELAQRQLAELEKNLMHQLPQPVQQTIATLARLQGVGWVGATRLVLELFWRDFANRKQVGACVGLVPQPYDSGNSHTDQGISKQGNARLRALLIEMAWAWLRHQPDSELAGWFARRTAGDHKRGRRVAIVAVARRLAIDLWRYLHHGVIPAGAKMKPAGC
jgi:transposase